VVFDGPKNLIGEFVQVFIEDASPYTLFGRLSSPVLADNGEKTKQGMLLEPITLLGSRAHDNSAEQSNPAYEDRESSFSNGSRSLYQRRLSLPIVQDQA
jgi:hypothetical protein